MTTITVNVQHLKALISDLVEAEVADSWAGSQPKEDWPIYRAEVAAARAAITEYLQTLQGEQTVKWQTETTVEGTLVRPIPTKIVRLVDHERVLIEIQQGAVNYDCTQEQAVSIQKSLIARGMQCKVRANRIGGKVLGYCIELTGNKPRKNRSKKLKEENKL